MVVFVGAAAAARYMCGQTEQKLLRDGQKAKKVAWSRKGPVSNSTEVIRI